VLQVLEGKKIMPIDTEKRKRGLIVQLRVGGMAFGLFLVAIGIVLLLGQLGIVSSDYLFHFFWPAILIFLGVELMFTRGRFPRSRFNREAGGFLILAGVILLLSKLGYFHFSFSVVWALACIYWGIWIVARTYGMRRWFESHAGRVPENNVIDVSENDSAKVPADVSAIFGTSKRVITSRNFKTAKLEAIFGEVGFDLTRAEIEGDEATVQADSVFGACIVRVPETWHISVRGSAVMGEFIDKTRQRPMEGPGVKTLVVVGSATFGSVEVKN
jgi:predicted membrane protein